MMVGPAVTSFIKTIESFFGSAEFVSYIDVSGLVIMANTNNALLPWVEKYRPKALSDIVGNTSVVDAFMKFAQERSFPNLILSGPPGVGKTTSVRCLARELWGRDSKYYVLSLNASDDRGIAVVRERIKEFAQTKAPSKTDAKKIVILDEADSMTTAAQQSLRRVIENFSDSTRFAFACNDQSKIIEPIQSRCAVLQFSRLSDEDICRRLIHVAQAEEVSYEDSGLMAIVFTADGDMRPALNNLQATSAGFGDVTEQNVYSICDVPHPGVVQEILEKCDALELQAAYRLLMELYDKGYASVNLVTTIARLIKNLGIADDLKIQYLRECATAHMRVLDGMTGKLQLAWLLARLCHIRQEESDRM